MTCPYKALKRKGLCGGRLVLKAINSRPGYWQYKCETCGKLSERKAEHVKG